MIASLGGHVECVKSLLDQGVNVDFRDEVSTVSQSIIVRHVPLCNKGIVEVACLHNSTYM